ncbi:MAG: hypothetical protein KJ718_02850 [Nanoarchaeota archaeon]|nr:hypothetical protein [Nanoarchaeota archaeon]MBU1051467.1 hypothetical protein [Nanoarchaeota archaeon]
MARYSKWTSEKLTESYLEQLRFFVNKIQASAHAFSKKNLSIKKMQQSVKRFEKQISESYPLLKRNHFVLILDTGSFYFTAMNEYRGLRTLQVYTLGGIGEEYLKTPARVLGKGLHLSSGDGEEEFFTLQLFDSRQHHTSLSVDGVGTVSRHPYVFLPHPDHLERFVKMLPNVSKETKDLERILAEYYNGTR